MKQKPIGQSLNDQEPSTPPCLQQRAHARTHARMYGNAQFSGGEKKKEGKQGSPRVSQVNMRREETKVSICSPPAHHVLDLLPTTETGTRTYDRIAKHIGPYKGRRKGEGFFFPLALVVEGQTACETSRQSTVERKVNRQKRNAQGT